jgi:aspartyl protease family protein
MLLTMTADNLLEAARNAVSALTNSQLLLIALAAMVVGWIGAMMIRRGVRMGRFVRAASTLVLVGVLGLVVLQLARFDPRLAVALPQIGMPEQVVEGGETRITQSADGHFWLRAEINGVPANFLVDTGATVTAVSQDLAREAGLEPRRGGLPVMIGTANGSVNAQLSTIDEMRFGNVAARGLDVVIAPTLGETNVVGMNLLSRLKSYRVDNRASEMILVPNNPQDALPVR